MSSNSPLRSSCSLRTESSAQPIVRAPAMSCVYERVRRVASTALPVLITGETGTGKELVAEALHHESGRAAQPFVALNCGALAPTLLETGLFGHVRGAFTGADRNALGAFQQADGGTLFLDEVGELGPAAQVALLRALETGRVRPVGATHETQVSVRIVAATNRELDAMVEQGTFRRDLLHRIDALALRLPPLRERREEIEPLAQHFLERAHGGPRGFELSALQCLVAHTWPGNVRELRNAVESAAALCEGVLIAVHDLPERVREASVPCAGQAPRAAQASEPASGGTNGSYRDRLRAYETQLLLDGLRRTGGNQCRAAELLAIPRRTLCRRIKELGIVRELALH